MIKYHNPTSLKNTDNIYKSPAKTATQNKWNKAVYTFNVIYSIGQWTKPISHKVISIFWHYEYETQICLFWKKKTHSVVSCNSRASIPIITEHLLNLNRFRAGEGIERISPNHLVHHNVRWNEACELLCAKQWSHHGFAIRSLLGAASHRITVTWNLLWQLLQVTQ